MIPIAKPILDQSEKTRVMEVLESGMISIGQVVKDFESAFAEYCGSRYAIATSSGTSALHLALLGAGISPGWKVLTTPFTFVATANSILYCGAKPVFCDVEDQGFNIDPVQIRKALEKDRGIKALLLVHLYGQSCNMDEIMKIVKEYDLVLIEDAAQAHGARYGGRHVGAFGKAGTFSFYPTKNMTTAEGGMIISDDPEFDKRVRLFREHGDVGNYDHSLLGYNFRMTNIEAAIGLGQLEKLNEFNRRRKENAEYYDKHLKGLDWLQTPVVMDKCEHCYHQYTLRVFKDRDRFADYLKDNGVGSKIYYPRLINQQTLYMEMGYDRESFPVAEKLSREVISIPIHPALSAEDREKVVKVIRDYR